MIKAESDMGKCGVMLSGTPAVLAAETGTLIQAIYNGILEKMPPAAYDSFGNMYRLCVLKSLTECLPENDKP